MTSRQLTTSHLIGECFEVVAKNTENITCHLDIKLHTKPFLKMKLESEKVWQKDTLSWHSNCVAGMEIRKELRKYDVVYLVTHN